MQQLYPTRQYVTNRDDSAKGIVKVNEIIYVTTKLLRYETLMALIIYCSVASTINLLTNLKFLPDKIVLDLKELLPFTTNDTEAKKKLVGFAFS